MAWRSSLDRAEGFLANRLIVLERQLPADGKDSQLWSEYVATVAAYAALMGQLTRTLVAAVPPRGAMPPREGPRRA
jgi:hypothetical protein